MKADETMSAPIPYKLEGEKVMWFDGVKYEIQENIISTITHFTLKNVEGLTTTTIRFERR